MRHCSSGMFSNHSSHVINPSSHPSSVIACIGFIFAISWKLTVVMLALTPVAAFTQVASSRVQQLHFSKVVRVVDVNVFDLNVVDVNVY